MQCIYIFTSAWGFQRCSFRQSGQCEGLYTVERVTDWLHVFCMCTYTFIWQPVSLESADFMKNKYEKRDSLHSGKSEWRRNFSFKQLSWFHCLLYSYSSTYYSHYRNNRCYYMWHRINFRLKQDCHAHH